MLSGEGCTCSAAVETATNSDWLSDVVCAFDSMDIRRHCRQMKVARAIPGDAIQKSPTEA